MVQFIVKMGNSIRLKCVNTLDNIDLFTYVLVPSADNLCSPDLDPDQAQCLTFLVFLK